MQTEPEATAVVLVAHGSRASAANLAHLDLAAALDARMTAAVSGAFMELAQPSIAEAIGAAVDAGAAVVAVVPYFLHPGRHQQHDIPQLVAQVADARPDADIRLLDYFGADPGVLDLLASQVDRALNAP